MTSTLTSKALLVSVAASLAALGGCSSKEQYVYPLPQPPAAVGGTGGGAAGDFWQAEPGSNPGAAGAENDVTKVWKSAGCGKAYEGPVGTTKITIGTTGEKDAACNAKLMNGMARCGPWGQESSEWLPTPLLRDYYLYLPQNYDPGKAYPIVFQGPGCGGNGTQTYPLQDGSGQNVSDSVIRVGLTPASSKIIGHGCCPYDCFDDHEGDDSVDWVFYENLYDKLNEELCFDRNRVFTSGNSSGSWLANELACKYAGDTTRPVRAPLPHSGALPLSPTDAPTCTQAPMAGMWVHHVEDPENPFEGTKVAVNRVLALNGCTAADYDTAPKENFPIGGGQAPDNCQRFTGCNPLYPLVVCALPGPGRGSDDQLANPAFATFLKLFSTGALFAP